MDTPLAAREPVFSRDRFTWLGYILLALLTYQQAAFGPIMPFLREELGLNFTEGSYHLSAAAGSVILIGLTGDRIIGFLGRRASIWTGAAVFVGGLLLVIFGRVLAVTVGGSLLLAAGGSLIQTTVQAGLTDHHGPNRGVAISEANAGASLLSTLAPFLVGLYQRAGFLGWRGALLTLIVLVLGVYVAFRGTPIPEPAPQSTTRSAPPRRLPLLFWLYCTLLAMVAAIEWSTAFWGADFLERIVGLERVDAATVMSLFFVAMVAGRFAGSRLARRFSSARLLVGALLVAVAGFLMLWLGRAVPVNLIGLFGVGLGAANLFPQGLSIALGVTPERANTASARVALAVGVAIFVAPQALGRAADSIGLREAFGIIGLMLLGGLALALAANSALARRSR
jgi:fucose permease